MMARLSVLPPANGIIFSRQPVVGVVNKRAGSTVATRAAVEKYAVTLGGWPELRLTRRPQWLTRGISASVTRSIVEIAGIHWLRRAGITVQRPRITVPAVVIRQGGRWVMVRWVPIRIGRWIAACCGVARVRGCHSRSPVILAGVRRIRVVLRRRHAPFRIRILVISDGLWDRGWGWNG
jgi:hypothetical protein